MKRLSAVAVLVSVLSVSVLAGDIPISGSPTPAPIRTTQTNCPGDIPSVELAGQLSTETLSALLSAFGFLA